MTRPAGTVHMTGLTFYTGAHQPHWLWRAGFPLFVSHRQLARKRQLRPALARWALDSGGFTELTIHGRWLLSAEDYAAAVTEYRDKIGNLDFAAPLGATLAPGVYEGPHGH